MRFPEDCYCEAPRRKAKKGVHGDHLALFGLRLRWLANRLHRGGNESGEAPKGAIDKGTIKGIGYFPKRDIFWLRDEILEAAENLPDPDGLAQEIVENPEAPLEQ